MKNIFKFLLAIFFLSVFSFSACDKDKDKDETSPVITLIGNNPMVIFIYTAYTEPGATADDDVDGDISANIVITHNIDKNTLGTYNVKYNVSDKAGNDATEVVRVVKVEQQP